MPYNLNGTYTVLPSPTFPAVAGATIYAASYNSQINDLAAALNLVVLRDGRASFTGNLNLGGYRVSNAGTPSAETDCARGVDIRNQSLIFLPVTGTKDLVASPSIRLTAYSEGQRFNLLISGPSTSDGMTLNISDLGARAITFNGGQAIPAGAFPANTVLEVIYIGTPSGGSFLLLTSSRVPIPFPASTVSVKNADYSTTSGTASSVAWANVSGRPTAISAFTNDSGFLSSVSWNLISGKPTALSAFTNDSITWSTLTGKPNLFSEGQSWQEFPATDRARATKYTNTTTRPIMVIVRVTFDFSTTTSTFLVDQKIFSQIDIRGIPNDGNLRVYTHCVLVPPSSTYEVVGNSIIGWMEYR